MKKIYFLLAVSFLMISLTSAITFEKTPETNTIIVQYNQPANIQLTIKDAPSGRYNLYTLTDVRIDPTDSFIIDSDNHVIDLKVFPTQSLTHRGFYTFVYYLRDFNSVNHQDRITVKVVDLRDALEISSDSNFPGEEMTFFVRNKENANIENIQASFNSIFFSTTETFSLKPFERKEFRISVNRDELRKIPAGNYLIESVFQTDRGEVELTGRILFGESKDIQSQEDTKGILIRTFTSEKVNSGNTIETVRFDANINLFVSFFTFFSEKPEGVTRTGLTNNYFWTKRISPSESLEIQARTNYLIPLIIILVLVGLVYTLRKFNSTRLELRKSVSHIKTKGGEFALRVRVHVKAHKNIENVSIVERIPAIVKVHENFGVLKPTSINLKDRRLQWDLGNLQAGEERMFSYVVYSKVGVVGKFSLPSSVGIFEENGNISETFSNNVFFLSEQVKKQ